MYLNPLFRVPFAVGVAAAPSELLVSSYCDQHLYSVACDGTFSVLTTIPTQSLVSGLQREIRGSRSIAVREFAVPPFTPRDIFITQGADIFKFSGGILTPFRRSQVHRGGPQRDYVRPCGHI